MIAPSDQATVRESADVVKDHIREMKASRIACSEM